MPFIQRDRDKKIIAIFSVKNDDAQEKLANYDNEIINFLESDHFTDYSNHLLNQADDEDIF